MYGLDLFSGIGGITKALEGYVTPVAYCENDRYAQGVLLSRMYSGDLPIAPIWDDVTTLRGRMLPKQVEIVYGGFPCQDISCAGRGAGLDGERSGLFFEIARLVGEIRPRFVFLENVRAITGRGLGSVVTEMERLRYDCRWGILSARDVGANHRRERWWMLAHAGRSERQPIAKGRHEPDRNDTGREETTSGIRERRENVADPARSRCGQEHTDAGGPRKREAAAEERRGFTDGGWWETEPAVGRLVNGLPHRVGQLRALGNAVVPAQAREAFERLIGLSLDRN